LDGVQEVDALGALGLDNRRGLNQLALAAGERELFGRLGHVGRVVVAVCRGQ
jgi:hypothetical protein